MDEALQNQIAACEVLNRLLSGGEMNAEDQKAFP